MEDDMVDNGSMANFLPFLPISEKKEITTKTDNREDHEKTADESLSLTEKAKEVLHSAGQKTKEFAHHVQEMLVCDDKKEEKIENGEIGDEDIRELEDYEHMKNKRNLEKDENLTQKEKLAQELFGANQFTQA